MMCSDALIRLFKQQLFFLVILMALQVMTT